MKKVIFLCTGNSCRSQMAEGFLRHLGGDQYEAALTGDAIMREKLVKDEKVTVLNDAKVLEVTGNKFVEAVRIEHAGKQEDLAVQGVFVEIGLAPNTNFKSGLALNEQGEIKVSHCNETNIPGLFAAGDVTEVPEKQIIIAAGEGAKAALRAFSYISKSDEKW